MKRLIFTVMAVGLLMACGGGSTDTMGRLSFRLDEDARRITELRPKRWQEWERKYSGLSTAQYIFLIMQDDLHYDDEAIAAALNVKRTSVRSMRSRIKGRER
jgi:hypothetical protein